MREMRPPFRSLVLVFVVVEDEVEEALFFGQDGYRRKVVAELFVR